MLGLLNNWEHGSSWSAFIRGLVIAMVSICVISSLIAQTQSRYHFKALRVLPRESFSVKDSLHDGT